MIYSFGIAHPGAIVLHNFPQALCDFTKEDRNTGEKIRIDLAAIDVMRDRERGVPRYNQFRRLLRLPPAGSFEALTANRVWAEELREVYDDDIERLDAMVGMYAEPPPKGFGFSETAFRIFILMASRRLKSDRFFAADFTPRVYTPARHGVDQRQRHDERPAAALSGAHAGAARCAERVRALGESVACGSGCSQHDQSRHSPFAEARRMNHRPMRNRSNRRRSVNSRSIVRATQSSADRQLSATWSN